MLMLPDAAEGGVIVAVHDSSTLPVDSRQESRMASNRRRFVPSNKKGRHFCRPTLLETS